MKRRRHDDASSSVSIPLTVGCDFCATHMGKGSHDIARADSAKHVAKLGP